jgi:phage shock protein PspC (stress-responsive transcriptional regulator)
MKKLHLSIPDRKIAGVCGGLGESTGIDADIIRAIFLVSIFAGGMGVILYLILWAVLPEEDYGEKIERTGIFSKLVRSRDGLMLGGVCAGIANYLEWDVSVIRLLFIIIVLAGGVGIPVYLVLWILMPVEKRED